MHLPTLVERELLSIIEHRPEQLDGEAVRLIREFPECEASISELVRVAREDVEPERPELGRYRLLERLGVGGMGVVYRAEHLDTKQEVAIKTLRWDVSLTPAAAERFREEARLAAGLEHPRCVLVYDADVDGDRPYLAMELLAGPNLGELVRREGPLGHERATRLMVDVLEGLAALHDRGVLHRDLKPDNCFLGADGRAKLGDFGLSRTAAEMRAVREQGVFSGTPSFAAPEQLRGEALDERADVYGAAATFYYLLTGHTPQVAEQDVEEQSGADAAMQQLRTLGVAVPNGLESLLRRALSANARRRPEGAMAFLTALRSLLPENLVAAPVRKRFAAFVFDVAVLESVAHVYTAVSGNAVVLTGSDPLQVTLFGALVVAYFACSQGGGLERFAGSEIAGAPRGPASECGCCRSVQSIAACVAGPARGGGIAAAVARVRYVPVELLLRSVPRASHAGRTVAGRRSAALVEADVARLADRNAPGRGSPEVGCDAHAAGRGQGTAIRRWGASRWVAWRRAGRLGAGFVSCRRSSVAAARRSCCSRRRCPHFGARNASALVVQRLVAGARVWDVRAADWQFGRAVLEEPPELLVGADRVAPADARVAGIARGGGVAGADQPAAGSPRSRRASATRASTRDSRRLWGG